VPWPPGPYNHWQLPCSDPQRVAMAMSTRTSTCSSYGRMLWTSDRLIYVLYTDGTWQSFPDTFVDQP